MIDISKVVKIILSVMCVCALFVSVFSLGTGLSFFDTGGQLLSLVTDYTYKIVDFLPFDINPLIGFDDEIPFKEFYLLRFRFGEGDIYYVDFALPDLKIQEPFKKDFYFLDCNYPAADFYINEAWFTSELNVYSCDPDELLLVYMGWSSQDCIWITEEEYLLTYYQNASASYSSS